MDLVFAVAQLHNTVDDSAWVGGQRSFRRPIRFRPADVESVKLDETALSTLPDAPPAAGPDRALDPPPPSAGRPDGAAAEVAVVAAPEPLLAVTLTMP